MHVATCITCVQMNSIAPFTIETGGQKAWVIWCGYWTPGNAWGYLLPPGDVMPSSCLVKRCYGIHL